MSMSDAEAQYQADVESNLKRNYFAHLCHGLLGQTGFRLVSTPTFLPAYIFSLSGSDFAVGLSMALQSVGGLITPILGATQVEKRQRVLPLGFVLGALMRLQILGFALAGWFLSPEWALVAILICLTLMGLFQGVQGVIFNFLMSKVIPVRLRGKLVGFRQFLGGLAAAGTAYVGGTYLVAGDVWGNGYATTFFVGFCMTSVGLLMLTIMKEPVPPTVREHRDLKERLSDLPGLMRNEPAFARYVMARAFAMMGMMAMPFYILFAKESVGLTGEVLGTLSLAFLLAQTSTNLVWGPLADRTGFRLVFLASLLLWIAAVVLLLGSSTLWAIAIAYVGIGAGSGGFMISSQNLVLEFGGREDLPMRIAIANTAASIFGATGPILGGVLAVSFSYASVLWTAIVFKVSALILVWLFVEEPRHRSSEDRDI